MDIGWYKDNIALQAELKREYPAVAELIDRLKGELAFEQFSANHNEEVVKERIAEVKALERQLAHKQEQCDQLAHEVLELEQQLARYQSKYNNLLAVAHRDGGQYLAQHGEEVAGEDAITAIITAYHNNDRYQGGVEVEGQVFHELDASIIALDNKQLPDKQQVRALVYPQADKGAVALEEVE